LPAATLAHLAGLSERSAVTFRILFLNTDYPNFLAWHYRRHPGLAQALYDHQMGVRNASLFGTADFMSAPMERLGQVAIDVHSNNRALQESWMREHGDGGRAWLIRVSAALVPERLSRRLIRLDPRSPRFQEILKAQIDAFQPNILYNHDPNEISGDLLKMVLPRDCALVGQIASPYHPETSWAAYDLMISSLPNFVAAFRRGGTRAEYLPLAFEPRVLQSISDARRDVPLSFVGSLSSAHSERLAFLESIAKSCDLAIWGDGVERLGPESPLRSCHRDAAWGVAMFFVLRRSQLTLNKHIDVSENYANNMRLFEATGMGACLITDWKENLADLFEPGKEVLTYRSNEECLDLIRYYAGHAAARETIGAAGQARCHREHTYERRMNDLVNVLTRYFG
jgi:spore maturation protein CgeB